MSRVSLDILVRLSHQISQFLYLCHLLMVGNQTFFHYENKNDTTDQVAQNLNDL